MILLIIAIDLENRDSPAYILCDREASYQRKSLCRKVELIFTQVMNY
ncbi:hypothetical protein [Argonema antarcticum]|nr:hypothetical protein [Argonema antarcticum]MCL1474641.1 hypothetical protein [Argonema antarcticum A004/B2]